MVYYLIVYTVLLAKFPKKNCWPPHQQNLDPPLKYFKFTGRHLGFSTSGYIWQFTSSFIGMAVYKNGGCGRRNFVSIWYSS